MASKTLYQEVIPLYFRIKNIRFLEAEELSSFWFFLQIIGPHHRQHNTKTTFYLRLPDNAKVFKQIARCPSLEHLSVVIQSYRNPRMELTSSPAIRNLLEFRNFKSVHVDVLHDSKPNLTMDDLQEFVKSLEVLKQPYMPPNSSREQHKGSREQEVYERRLQKPQPEITMRDRHIRQH